MTSTILGQSRKSLLKGEDPRVSPLGILYRGHTTRGIAHFLFPRRFLIGHPKARVISLSRINRDKATLMMKAVLGSFHKSFTL